MCNYYNLGTPFERVDILENDEFTALNPLYKAKLHLLGNVSVY